MYIFTTVNFVLIDLVKGFFMHNLLFLCYSGNGKLIGGLEVGVVLTDWEQI